MAKTKFNENTYNCVSLLINEGYDLKMIHLTLKQIEIFARRDNDRPMLDLLGITNQENNPRGGNYPALVEGILRGDRPVDEKALSPRVKEMFEFNVRRAMDIIS